MYRAVFVAVLALLITNCAASDSETEQPVQVADSTPVASPSPIASTEVVEPAASPSPIASTEVVEPTDVEVAPAAQGRRIALPSEISALEGIAVDPTTDRVFVGDFSEGTVWVGDAGGVFEPFARASDRTAAVGLATDAAARRLYVATLLLGRVDIHDLDSGELLSSVELETEPGSIINDVTVAPDGVAFVTDSGIGRLHAYDPASGSAQILVDVDSNEVIDGTVASLQLNGVVADDDVVLTVHMASGNLYRVDRATGEVEAVALSGVDSPGRDGLLLCGDRLFSVVIDAFNDGIGAVRIIDLDIDRRSGTHVEDVVDPSFSSPATLDFLDGEMLVTNAQFSSETPETPFWLSAVPADC